MSRLGSMLKCGELLGKVPIISIEEINRNFVQAHDAPWVGAKLSGYGFHSSLDRHRQFAQLRVVNC